LSRIYDPNAQIKEVESLVMQDVSLSYRLVRCVNSALYAPSCRVESIRQAITMLGLKQLGTWVSLISLSGIEDKPHELIVTAMVRAKMCEALARSLKLPAPEGLFTVGLFSVLDALMDMPMEDVLANMPLAKDIVGALLRGEGKPGEVLAAVKAHEGGRFEEVAKLGLEPSAVTASWLSSVKWAEDAVAAILPPKV
jgi:EAL and modified HD-GYP domain-containing signal transduction protein